MTNKEAIYELQTDCWYRDAECNCRPTCYEEENCHIKKAIEALSYDIIPIGATFVVDSNLECPGNIIGNKLLNGIKNELAEYLIYERELDPVTNGDIYRAKVNLAVRSDIE